MDNVIMLHISEIFFGTEQNGREPLEIRHKPSLTCFSHISAPIKVNLISEWTFPLGEECRHTYSSSFLNQSLGPILLNPRFHIS